MLARLLQQIIIVLCLCGAAVGYGLAPLPAPAWANTLVFSVLWPFFTLLLITLVSVVRAHTDAPLGMWWRAFWGEYKASVRVFLMRQPWTTATPSYLPATGSSARIPVVLVHGYLCNYRTWDTLANALRAQGHPVVAVNLEHLFTSIDRYVPIVDAAVTTLRQQTGAKQVALVGHSMGGLAIRAWMRTHGTQQVARVITLGTPHAGTRADPLPLTPNSRQMVWNSDWLQALSASETDTTRALLRIGIAAQDNIVYPQRAQVLPGVAATVFEGMGHMQLCLEPQPVAWVCQQLAELGRD